MKMCKMNYFSIFSKSRSVQFLALIIALQFYAAPLV